MEIILISGQQWLEMNTKRRHNVLNGIEKEIKIILDEKQYLEVMNSFQFSESFEQINYYYANREIIENNITIRIREKLGQMKLQLKIPQKTDKALHINKEYEKKVNRVLQHISKEEIYELSGLHCSNDVKLLGSLKTIRCICNTFPNVKIALDKSFYFNNIDYEIEIEYVDELSIDIVDRLKMLDLHLDKDVNGKNKRFLSAYKKYN